MVAIPRFIPGDRVGNYEIVREVGAHNGGVVYEVAHRVLPRRATLKVMHGIVPALDRTALPSGSASRCARAALAVQLMREACILEALQHPGIVKVFESGVLPDRRPWFALELVPGEPLSTVLGRGALRAVETVTLVKELAEILEHAHRRGVIHHGLRPERVVLSDRRLCIVDWSEARAHDASNQIPHIPAPSARAYIAPEVARGDVTDDRADVFALGAIAYQALTGALPTPSAHIPAAQRCRNAPPELTTLIEQMLAPDRFDRPTAAEVRAELAWLASILEAAPPERVDHVELVDTDGIPEAPLPRIRKPRWTPPISYVASDLAVLVSGEIELD